MGQRSILLVIKTSHPNGVWGPYCWFCIRFPPTRGGENVQILEETKINGSSKMYWAKL